MYAEPAVLDTEEDADDAEDGVCTNTMLLDRFLDVADGLCVLDGVSSIINGVDVANAFF
jgi:hypothetical protein